jgi:hypothetical protein
MNLPTELTLPALRQALHDIHTVLRPLQAGVVDLRGGRIIGAGKPIDAKDYVRKFDLDQVEASVMVKTITETRDTALTVSGPVRIGAFAVRGSAVAHANELFLASDRDYIGFISTGAVWAYAFGEHRDAIANRPTPTSDETNYAFYATDTFVLYYWDGAAWIEDILSTIERFGGLTSSFPALKRSSAILQVRLADDSAHTDLEVLDEAYDATTWNASVEVPTKNAVRDKIETVTGGETAALVSDAAYGAGWNGVATIAPSKNAVYDKIETLMGSSAYTPTNVTADRSYDADAVLISELADVLGTLIADLQGKGILS